MATAASVAPPPSIPRVPVARGPVSSLADHNDGHGRAAAPSGKEPVSPTKRSAAATTAARSQQRPARPPPTDFLSDKSTATFIRRTLCAQYLVDRGRAAPAPIEELLPPLTSRNDVDLQLYALISVILRDAVQNWYSKITPDETFVAEIVQIIAHSTRALEQRLRKVNLESLLLDELPDLLDAHVRAYRIAKDASAARPPLESNLREVYHSLWPLPALSPVPHLQNGVEVQGHLENELAYRQLLVQGLLALLLPTEDLQNECLEAIVRQIISELVIGNLLIEKLAQPWLILEIIIILTRLVRKPESPTQRTDQTSSDKGLEKEFRKPGSSWVLFFWSIIQGLFSLVSFVRLLINAVVLSRSLPPRNSSLAHGTKPAIRVDGKTYASSIASDTGSQPPDVPVASYAIWSCIGNLFEVQARMPWLGGALCFWQWVGMIGPGQIANVDGVLDRLLSHCIQTYMLSPDRLPPLLRSIRASLFPNNAPGTSTLIAPSSDEELAALKRKCAKAVWAVIPKTVGRLYFGADAWTWAFRTPLPQQQQQQQQRGIEDKRSGPLKGSGRAEDEANPNRPDDGSGLGDSRDQQHGTTTAHGGGHVTQWTSPHRLPPQKKQGGQLAGAAAVHSRSHVGHGRHTTPQRHQQEQEQQPRQHASEKTPDRTSPGMAHLNNTKHDLKGKQGQSVAEKEGGEDEDEKILSEIESGILDVFSDPYCNKHLLYGILELILVRLMPELAERGVIDLLEERLV